MDDRAFARWLLVASMVLPAVLTRSLARAQEEPPQCDAMALAAGSRHTMALRSGGSVWAWGENSWGQLGDASLTDRPVPVQVVGAAPGTLGDVVAIAAGGWHSLALGSDGTVRAWGSNAFGQLGQHFDPAATAIRLSSTPLVVEDSSGPIPGVMAIAAGSHHSLMLMADGTVFAWGDNEAGQLGNGNTDSSDTAVGVAGLNRVIAIAAGHNHSLALRSDGTVWSWGYNSNGQLGRGLAAGSYHDPTTAQVSTLADVKAIAAGTNHCLALRNDGTVWAWGWNEDGQLGDGSFTDRPAPVQVVGPSAGTFLVDIKSVAGGGRHSLALRSDGTVWAWGYNRHGQLGAPASNERSNVPVQAREYTDGPFLTGLALVTAGALHSAAFKPRAEVQLQAWGLDDRGQLGDTDTTTTTSSTTEVVTVELDCQPCEPTFVAVSAGQGHTVGLKGDGVVATWGDDVSGQLGNGTPLAISLDPVFVDESTGFKAAVAVAAGHQHTLALAPDGTVWSWGKNHRGQLGNGTSGTDSPVPVRVLEQATGLPMTNVLAVDAGGYHSLALRANGEVWAWGDNTYGQIGISPVGGSSAFPVLVGTLPLAAALVGGGDHSVALTAGGQPWSWGRGDKGQLGNGSILPPGVGSPSPVQASFPGAERVSHAAAGLEHSLAREDDGTVWAWGANAVHGQVGNNGTVDEDSPVLVQFPPDFRLVAVGAGDHHSLAVRRDVTEGGTVWAWGRNDASQLGDQTSTSPRRSPVATVGLTGATQVDGGTAYSVARDGDGLLWAWGANGLGQFGDGSTVPASEPVPSAPDDYPGPEGNILSALKVAWLEPQPDVYLEFPGATAFSGRWRILRWENLKHMPPPPLPPVDAAKFFQSPILTAMDYLDANAVPKPPLAPTPFVYYYQVRGGSRVCSYPGP